MMELQWERYAIDDRRQVLRTPYGTASIYTECVDDAFTFASKPEVFGFTSYDGAPPIPERSYQGKFIRNEEKAKADAAIALAERLEETARALRELVTTPTPTEAT